MKDKFSLVYSLLVTDFFYAAHFIKIEAIYINRKYKIQHSMALFLRYIFKER